MSLSRKGLEYNMNWINLSNYKITGLDEMEEYLKEKFKSDIKACNQNVMILVIGIPLLILIGIIVCHLNAVFITILVSIMCIGPIYLCYILYESTKEIFYKSLDEIDYLKNTPLKNVKYSYINSKLSIVYNDSFSSNLVTKLEIIHDENLIDYQTRTLKLKISEDINEKISGN